MTRCRVVTAGDVIDALGTDIDIIDQATVDLDGLTATRFDVRVPPDALCTAAEPCEHAFRASSGMVVSLRSTHAHRIWWIEDGADGPSMILAMAPLGHDFIDRATGLLATMSFNDQSTHRRELGLPAGPALSAGFRRRAARDAHG